MTALYQLVSSYRELQRLEDEDIPEEVIRDTLEALEGDVQLKATNVAKFMANLDAFADSVDDAAKQMKERAARIRRKSDAIRAYLLNCMQGAGISKIQAPEFTISIRKNPPSVLIAPDALVPPEFMVTPEPPPPHPDKKRIAAALKEGQEIPGCSLNTTERLHIQV